MWGFPHFSVHRRVIFWVLTGTVCIVATGDCCLAWCPEFTMWTRFSGSIKLLKGFTVLFFIVNINVDSSFYFAFIFLNLYVV